VPLGLHYTTEFGSEVDAFLRKCDVCLVGQRREDFVREYVASPAAPCAHEGYSAVWPLRQAGFAGKGTVAQLIREKGRALRGQRAVANWPHKSK
jgi:hypothetical protein